MENQSSSENNNGEDHHGGRCNDEFQETVEIVTLQEISLLLESQPKTWKRPRVQRVPPQFRRRKEHVYDPVMVSIGPYHHGKQELRRAEEFKYHCLVWCTRGNKEKKGFFYNKIFEKIAEIRECYAEVTIDEKYDDKALALMMLLDSCFIINFMHIGLGMKRGNFLDWQKCLGIGSVALISRDIMVLENQIPFQVLNLLISLQYEKEEAQGFLQRFFYDIMRIDLSHAKILEEPPIHLFEACWKGVTTKEPIDEPHRFSMSKEKNDETDHISYAHRSVMDLKAKGIHFRPSTCRSLKNITFTSHAFYGQLQLPVRTVSDVSSVHFSNMIAYEVSPNNDIKQPVVLSYVIFMKSLIQSPEDVKELQQKGILLNRFANLEQVVKLFKEIDTFGIHNADVFMDVKQQVEEHCNSKAKTWIADLIHTRFQTPWTAIALFAAVFLLCLTFLQTFYTIHPVK